jgi:hypothetical protein
MASCVFPFSLPRQHREGMLEETLISLIVNKILLHNYNQDILHNYCQDSGDSPES